MNATRSVLVSYYDPFDIGSNIINEIKVRLPLKNLTWYYPPRPLRNITNLSLSFVEESLDDSNTPSHQINGLLESPYLKLILVRCEDNETYRESVRKNIREWFSTKVASKRDTTEWLIIYYAANGSTSSSSALRFKNSVFDKIRADFNNTKEDRCILISINYSSKVEANEAWSDAIAKVKDGVLDAFSSRVRVYEDEVKRIESQKSIPGWNFLTFFIMKEGLALSFESFALIEDALTQYDELENIFTELMKANSITFFQSVGSSADLAEHLLAQSNEDEIRKKIVENEISLLDFKKYLFSRQASLLLRLATSASSPTIAAVRIAEFLFRTRKFTAETRKMLVSYGRNPFLVANWIYSITQEILEASEMEPIAIEGGKTRDVAEGKAELILLARSSLEQLGTWKGWRVGKDALEDVDLDELTQPDTEEIQKNIEDSLHPGIREALVNELSFTKRYMELSEEAMAFFEVADRTRSVDKLRAQMAILKYKQKEYQQAADLLTKLPQLYLSQGWDVIAMNLFLIYADCLFKLGRNTDCLAIYLQILSHKNSEIETQYCEICENLQLVSGELDAPSYFPLKSLFEVSLPKYINASATDDSFSITADIINEFNIDWTINKVTVSLVEVSGMRKVITFESRSEAIELKHGKNTIELTSRQNFPGLYDVSKIELWIGSLALTETYNTENRYNGQCLRLFNRPKNFDVVLSTPRIMNLGEPKCVVISLKTGWNNVQSGNVTIKSMTNGVRLLLMEANGTMTDDVVHDDLKYSRDPEPRLTFGSLNSDSELSIFLPYQSEADIREITLRIQVEFRTDTDKSYAFSTLKKVPVSLSLSVNVQDIFKQNYLFSKFSVSCVGQSPLRIISSLLEENESYNIAHGSGSLNSYVAFPRQPVTLVYKISKKEMNILKNPSPLSLRIKYRKLSDELRFEISRIVREKLGNVCDGKYCCMIQDHMQSIFNQDIIDYGFTDTISFGIYMKADWSSIYEHIPYTDCPIIEDAIIGMYREYPVAFHELEHQTREVIIPVVVPRVQILFTVQLSTNSTLQSSVGGSHKMHDIVDNVFYIGDSIPVNLEIEYSTLWAPRQSISDDELLSGNIEFSYEAISIPDTWVISGRRRGHFKVSREKLSVPLILLPLRHGNLLLPTIEVRPGHKDFDHFSAEIDYKNNAQSLLVLPEVSNVMLAVSE
ncbi:trafficking protein particle complex subunit 10 [Dipodascopsis uninucleata]